METVQQFTVDELVNVTIKGARVVDGNPDDHPAALHLTYASPSTAGVSPLRVRLDGPGVTVERAASAEWPPQPGDIWSDSNDGEWVGEHVAGHSPTLQCISGEANRPIRYDAAEILSDLGPLKLVRRRGWTPAPEATDDEPAEVDERAAYISGLRAVVDLIQLHPEISIRGYYTTLLFDQETDSDVDLWAAALGTEAATKIRRTDGLPEYEAKANLGGGIVVHAYRIGRAPVLGDDVDDPADTGARTGCGCNDCEDIEAGQLDAADADRTAADAEQVLATVAEPDVTRCPDCGSQDPRLHPATQAEGEVMSLCHNAFHGLTAEVTA